MATATTSTTASLPVQRRPRQRSPRQQSRVKVKEQSCFKTEHEANRSFYLNMWIINTKMEYIYRILRQTAELFLCIWINVVMVTLRWPLTPAPELPVTPQKPGSGPVVVQGSNKNAASEKIERVRKWSITTYKVRRALIWTAVNQSIWSVAISWISSSSLSPCSAPGRLCQRSSVVDLVRWIWTWSRVWSCSKTTGSATITWPSWLRRWPISSLSLQIPRRPWGTPSATSASKRQRCTWVSAVTDWILRPSPKLRPANQSLAAAAMTWFLSRFCVWFVQVVLPYVAVLRPWTYFHTRHSHRVVTGSVNCSGGHDGVG